MSTDGRGALRGRCGVLSCTCPGYDGGSLKKRCVVCQHLPGQHLKVDSAGTSKATAYTGVKAMPALVAEVESDSVDISETFLGREKFSDPTGVEQAEMKRSKDGKLKSFSSSTAEATVASAFSDNISSRKSVTPTKAARALDGMMIEDVEDDEPSPAGLHHIFSLNSKPSTLGQSASTRLSAVKKLPIRTRSSVPFQMSGLQTDLVTRRPKPVKLTSELAIPTRLTSTICKLEGCLKPAHVEGTRVHDYCGITHYLLGTGQSEPVDVPEELRCNTPGCRRQKREKNQNGDYFDYCSISCRDRRLFQQPLQVAPVVKDICRIAMATKDEYQKQIQQFLSDWAKRKGDPPLQESISVYMITNSALEQKWQAYKDQLSDTTIEEHYHGTKLCCDVSSLQLCSNRSCGICGIARNGFDQSLMGTNISRFKRFGNAFYLAPHSSKCHDYTVGYGQHRAMLCFRVLPGRKFTLKKTDEKFVLPPGYDSAYGIPGQSLNYPELMLYESEAALPLCIFTYKKDGIHQIAK